MRQSLASQTRAKFIFIWLIKLLHVCVALFWINFFFSSQQQNRYSDTCVCCFFSSSNEKCFLRIFQMVTYVSEKNSTKVMAWLFICWPAHWHSSINGLNMCLRLVFFWDSRNSPTICTVFFTSIKILLSFFSVFCTLIHFNVTESGSRKTFEC